MTEVKTAALALLGVFASASAALAAPGIIHSIIQGERFPAVTIIAGQGVAANVSNVLIPPPAAACPVAVSFFAGDGTQIGSTQNIELKPGATASVTASAPAPGLVRAIVSIADTSRAQNCALKTDLEVFDATSGAPCFSSRATNASALPPAPPN
jgi:hypothetical protein